MASSDVASTGSRLRPQVNSTAKPDNMKIDSITPGGNTVRGPTLVVTGAVVATLTVTVGLVVQVICAEEVNRLHVGARVTTGVSRQLRFTVPVNEPVAPNTSWKLAVYPALMVWEVLIRKPRP